MYLKLSIFKKGVRYFSVVTVGFLADVLVFWHLTNSGIGILPANSLAFLLGFTINTAMIRILAFPTTKLPKKWDYFTTLLINIAVLYFSSKLILFLTLFYGFPIITAKLVASSFTLMINFLLRNLVERIW